MNDKELKSFLKYKKLQNQSKSQVKQSTNLETYKKVSNNSKKLSKSLEIQLAETIMIFMISARSRFIDMT